MKRLTLQLGLCLLLATTALACEDTRTDDTGQPQADDPIARFCEADTRCNSFLDPDSTDADDTLDSCLIEFRGNVEEVTEMGCRDAFIDYMACIADSYPVCHADMTHEEIATIPHDGQSPDCGAELASAIACLEYVDQADEDPSTGREL